MMPGPWFLMSFYLMGAPMGAGDLASANGRLGAWPAAGCIEQARDLGEADSGSFSPDGKQVVVSKEGKKGKDLYLVDVATGSAKPLVVEAGDDVDPVWHPNGKGVVFSSNREGSFDLWFQPVEAGGKAVRLTSHKGDERHPDVSPIPFVLNGLVLEGCGGPAASAMGRYHKVVYQQQEQGKTSVRFVSDDGAHDALVWEGCQAPRFASDGLAIVALCQGKVKVVSGDILTADKAAEIYASGQGKGEYPSLEQLRAEKEKWESEAPGVGESPDRRISSKVGKRYVHYEQSQYEAEAGSAEQVAMSHNQLLLLLSGKGQEPALVYDRAAQTDKAAAQRPGPAGGAFAFASTGKALLWVASVDGEDHLFVAQTRCPAQEVVDLVQYPEIWKGGIPGSLVRNQFVALPSQEKEFFHIYEKLRYRDRGILVTPDALLQAMSDVFSRMLQSRERLLAQDVLDCANLGFESVKGLKGATGLYLQTLFAVPVVLLEAGIPDFAANDMVPPWENGGVDEGGQADEAKKETETRDQRLAKALARFPKPVQTEAKKALALLAEQKIDKKEVGGMPYVVDFTLAKPRGHYDVPGYRDYFLAVSWLSQMPFPLDAVGVEAAAALTQNAEFTAAKEVIEGVTGAMAGVSALPSLREVVAAFPGGEVAKGHTGKAGEAGVAKVFGALKVRTPTAALLRSDAMEVRLLPPRLVLDTEILKELTHPEVGNRGMPTALDLFAALETPGVVDLIQPTDGDTWSRDAYLARLAAVSASVRGQTQPDTLYVSWIRLIQTLAATQPDGSVNWPGFAKSSAYHYRLLQSALAGFAQVKHHLVLYSAQDMGVECDGDSLVALLYEVPERMEPPARVEPVPGFYAALAKLARKTQQHLGIAQEAPSSAEEGVEVGSMEWYFPPAWNGPDSAERLARAAEFFEKMVAKELAGQPFTYEETQAIRLFGGTLESYVTGLHSHESGYVTGSDQGRNERGVTLVTDLFFNPMRNKVLHEAVGLPYEMFAVVDHEGTSTIVVGALLSWFEFTAPERMTDEAWWKQIVAGNTPDVAPWACSFVECTPKATP